MSLDKIRPEIEPHIRSIRDFPKKGINFRDIMPLFAQPKLVAQLCQAIADYAKTIEGGVQGIAGLEARGFLFGPQVAMLLDVPFVPIRKKGKLPGECVSASYVKEYGEDIVEVQKDAIVSGQRFLIIDDLLATGGTLRAAVDLISKAGGVPVEAFLLVELSSLEGRKKIPASTRITSFIVYDKE